MLLEFPELTDISGQVPKILSLCAMTVYPGEKRRLRECRVGPAAKRETRARSPERDDLILTTLPAAVQAGNLGRAFQGAF